MQAEIESSILSRSTIKEEIMLTSKYIYLAGPVIGCNNSEAKDWRKEFIQRLPRGIVGINPLRCEPEVGEDEHYAPSFSDVRFGTPKAISAKNYYDTTNSDLVLAYLPRELNERRPSYGTVIEIGWAIGTRKPIIVVTDDPVIQRHPLIEANVNWIVDNFNDAYDVITGLFVDYVVDKKALINDHEDHF